MYDNSTAKFYFKHPNLKWVKTTVPVAPNVPGAIKVQSPYGLGFVGRIDVTFSNGTFKQIGKVFDGYFFFTRDNLYSYDTTQGEFEVLACQ